MTATMEALQRASGAKTLQVDGKWIATCYGDVSAEHAAARTASGLIDLCDWEITRIEGPDRAAFIHGMVTNEVTNLRIGQGNYSLTLTPKGKIVSDLWLLARENDLLAITRGGQGTGLAEALDKYLIMEDARIIQDTLNWGVLALQGPRSAEVLENTLDGPLPEQDCFWTPIRACGEEFIVFKASIAGEEGFLLLGAPQALPALWRKFVDNGALPVGREALEILRIEAGIPICGKELSDAIIPQEAALHHALSFTKGCYIGQETVARLHFRGRVNRELTGFYLDRSEAPHERVELFHEDKPVGFITSACYSFDAKAVIGMGYLRVKLKEPRRRFEARMGDERFYAQVAELPFKKA